MTMKLLLLFWFAASVSMAASTPPALMPLPAQLNWQAGEMPLTNGFRVVVNGHNDARLTRAIERFTARLSSETGIPFLGAADSASRLMVECTAAGPAYPELDEDEAYRLSVMPAGARLSAKTTTGILRGLETVLQLATAASLPAVEITDQPRFPWRGLMLDVSRHWMPLPVVLRNLDAMAAVKLNVFHWHLADDQGFRVESKRYPRLQELGSDGRFYTQDEVRRVVEYAADRGIRVIPEFDVPGHTTAWFAGYPEYASAPGPYSIERTWGIFKPTMDPTREETYTFLDGVFGEMAGLFPDVNFHIGGDEVEETQWKTSATIQSFERAHKMADSRALHAYFNTRLQVILKKHGKSIVGWDEILNPELDPSAIIQSWRGAGSLIEAARKGYRTLLSGGYYLDHLKPAAEHYVVDPLADTAGLTKEQTARILGGEACMWTEYVSAETVDSRIWPRTAAIAERFWSPAGITADKQSMYARMERVSRLLEYTGITHRTAFVPMVDRLAGWQNAAPVMVLADAVDALGIAGRRGERKYSSPVPLNRLVDAARPESESARLLTLAVQAWLATRNAEDVATLQRMFAAWQANPDELRTLVSGGSLLAEALPVSENLAATGKVGAEAMLFLQNRQSPPDGWLQASRDALDRFEQPKAETRLAAVRPVRLLLDALQAAQQTAEKSEVRSR